MQVSNQWYRIYQSRPAAKQRVILLPHAGGSASFFHQWGADFSTSVEVVVAQYPGREERIGESMIDNMTRLVDALSNGLLRVLDKPYILFGHSMGGAVAYELYATLLRKGLSLPLHLVISAIEAPSRRHDGNLHRQDNDALKNELKRLNGTHIDLDILPELADMVLPLIRNDYRLIETYQPAKYRKPIAIPLSVMIGEQDDELNSSDAEAWVKETSQDFELLSFPGGHFYLVEQKTAVIQALSTILERIQPSAVFCQMP